MNSHDSVDPATARAVDIFLARLPMTRLPPVKRALLYGSRARGDFHEESDVDLAIVLQGSRPAQKILLGLHFLLADAEWNALDETELRVSAWPVWEDDLANPERTLNPDFFQNMTKEGIEWKWRWHES